MIVTFCGHSDFYKDQAQLEQWLEQTLRTLIAQGADTFYLGGYGFFDRLCNRILKQLKAEYPTLENILILAYLDRTQDAEHYASTLYPPLETVPKRLAIVRRNAWMVEQADIVVSGVVHSFGGASKTLAHAKRKHKPILQYVPRP